MIPVVTPDQMNAIDRAATVPTETLVQRAGAAVATAALAMLGGGYGRRVVVVAGKGNNGADGRVAAERLRRRGAVVDVVEAADTPRGIQGYDLVVDAAYGTGFRGEYQSPDPGDTPVLAVDIPSGVDGLTGQACAGAVTAGATITFAALKPGLLIHPGAGRAGKVTVADIGLDPAGPGTARSQWPEMGLVEHRDLLDWLPRRPAETHKWKTAVWVVAGSPGMTGAAKLCARAAMRAGAGAVRLGSPGQEAPDIPTEVVGRPLPAEGWDPDVLADLGRCRALVVGPGLGRSESTLKAVRRLVREAPIPVVIDADGLFALGDTEGAATAIAGRAAATVITPHEGEFARLTGIRPGPDRLESVRALAGRLGATVLLKGSTSIVADADGRALFANAGDARLATAGTGDVLAGVLAAFLAQGLDGLRAAGAAAYAHGAAARLGWPQGLLAGDLPDLLPRVLVADTRTPWGRTP